jgi:hypothetical protein
MVPDYACIKAPNGDCKKFASRFVSNNLFFFVLAANRWADHQTQVDSAAPDKASSFSIVDVDAKRQSGEALSSVFDSRTKIEHSYSATILTLAFYLRFR